MNDPFEKTLLDLGLGGEREVLQMRAREMGMAFVDLERTPIDAVAVAVVSKELCERHRVLPLKLVDRHLWVAMANPQSIQAIDELGRVSGCRTGEN
jgi:type IV pilus assembly protein PilB